MNEKTFEEGFYKLFGQSLDEFLRFKRLGYAAVLLVERNFSVATVMVMVNYREEAAFRADIREFYGEDIEQLRMRFPLNP